MMTEATMTLDVRQDIRDGREPFSRIMETVARLREGQGMRLIVPFEPVPLFDVLARRGFSHEARRMGTGDWEVLFTRSSGGSTEKTAAASQSVWGPAAIEVDARGLEPPQPLVVILEALANLPAGGEMHARTDRRPLHLYAELEDRGFTGETEEQHDGSFVTTIRRA